MAWSVKMARLAIARNRIWLRGQIQCAVPDNAKYSWIIGISWSDSLMGISLARDLANGACTRGSTCPLSFGVSDRHLAAARASGKVRRDSEKQVGGVSWPPIRVWSGRQPTLDGLCEYEAPLPNRAKAIRCPRSAKSCDDFVWPIGPGRSTRLPLHSRGE